MEQGPCVAKEKYMHLRRVKTIQTNFWWRGIFMQNSHFSKLKFSPKGPQFVLLMTFFLACITISIWGEKKPKNFSQVWKDKAVSEPWTSNAFFTNLFEWISSARFCKWIEWAALLAWHPVLGGLRGKAQPSGKPGEGGGRHGKGTEKALHYGMPQQQPHTTGPLPASGTPVPFHSSFGEMSIFGPWFKSWVMLTARS